MYAVPGASISWGCLYPDAGFVAGFLGAEGVLKVDSASVDDRHEQDQRIDGFIADVGCAAIRILGLSLEFADGGGLGA